MRNSGFVARVVFDLEEQDQANFVLEINDKVKSNVRRMAWWIE